MAIEEEEKAGVPEWVVTFGDMMSLLLTFFIMLVSLSEIKEEEKYQAMVESFHRQFGHQMSMASVVPGNTRPRNSQLAQVATMGRSRRLDTHKGGDKVSAPVGENPRVVIVRPGTRTTVGTVVIFSEAAAELSERNKRDLRRQIMEFKGKPLKIEIRGHTSLRPVAKDSQYRDNYDLAYARSRNTRDYLVEMGIDPKRIRLAVAGANEPLHIGTDRLKLRRNPRVEVFLLDEAVDDLNGTSDEKTERYTEENTGEKAK